MKGVILAGGNGTRLRPLTLITNKHLLPVYDMPMIEYPLDTLIRAGCDDILIISGREHCGHFIQYLGNGRDSVKFSYKVQDEAGGIGQALALAEGFIQEGEKFIAILGDNIFQDWFGADFLEFIESRDQAVIFTKEVHDFNRFGVYMPLSNLIVEKPENSLSKEAVTGIYFYDYSVFRRIAKCKASDRGEVEITDVNNLYLRSGMTRVSRVDGFWSDAGTFESLHAATEFIRNKRR